MKLRSAALLAFPLALAGALCAQGSGSSFMIGNGTVGATLNGSPVLPGTAVMPGDTVATSPGGTLVMSPANGGGVVEMSGHSQGTLPVGGGNLQLQQGNAMIAGGISVTTMQGTTFTPTTGTGTTYVVNASLGQTAMGVVAGAVSTVTKPVNNQPPPPPEVVPAGNAVSVAANNGTIQLENIKLAQVQKPSTDSTVVKTTPASQSN